MWKKRWKSFCYPFELKFGNVGKKVVKTHRQVLGNAHSHKKKEAIQLCINWCIKVYIWLDIAYTTAECERGVNKEPNDENCTTDYRNISNIANFKKNIAVQKQFYMKTFILSIGWPQSNKIFEEKFKKFTNFKMKFKSFRVPNRKWDIPVSSQNQYIASLWVRTGEPQSIHWFSRTTLKNYAIKKELFPSTSRIAKF